MQNWEHVKVKVHIPVFPDETDKSPQFVLNQINKLPKESHDTDFSRIKPWYLDGLYVQKFLQNVKLPIPCSAIYLRQSILLSAYETPDTRSMYNCLKNVAGKIRTEKRYNPISVPAGIDQVKKKLSISSSMTWLI